MMIYYENNKNVVIKAVEKKEWKWGLVVYKEIEGKIGEIKRLRKG